ncbi:MAG: aminopeptidase P family protein [Mesorhizobium sp.]|uniref:M24 family metallopeptidase n=1 Tax=Mesorhizobium sp. TaxID=1871066 RepID=UPI001AC4D82D|nr:Xaa-Pro peptidase family protein [Mesorhizobium sp.]MBN9218132.1 aminopeptidase P family protein [Mesorhizobium sp.]
MTYSKTEKLLAGFEPSFEFVPVDPLPEAEFADRLRRIRRAAIVGEYDALIVHADDVGWYHTSNSYLRYICDWSREGFLIIPTDDDKDMQLISFFSDSVILPPGGEPVLVEKISQVGCWGREYADRPGSARQKAIDAVQDRLVSLGLAAGRIGLIGDDTSIPYWQQLGEAVPRAEFMPENGIIDRMQRIRSPREIELFRAASALIDIGIQAAYHVTKPGVTDHEIYAAFTFAQMSRGGETGDGYQIGINRFGTHCGKPYGHVVAPGDLINLYISNVTYRGYFAQSARMIAVGAITAKQEEVLVMCSEGVRRAAAIARPGMLIRDINEASFSPFIERGYLADAAARTMPFNWESMPDGSPRTIERRHVHDADWERQGRRLNHVYPAQHGPHNPNLGHEVGLPGMPLYNISSNNYDRLEEGMVFVLHSQWLEPLVAGANVGDCFVVTSQGLENLTCNTPLEAHRVPSVAMS